jgi:hypothetical protein
VLRQAAGRQRAPEFFDGNEVVALPLPARQKSLESRQPHHPFELGVQSVDVVGKRRGPRENFFVHIGRREIVAPDQLVQGR